jgi:VCBS repeat-containing protein
MPTPLNKRVFISHSHRDRAVATDLQKTLIMAGAETYLDQDMIQGGDNLPKRIYDGLSWCDTFLLIWSTSAATSPWVNREWNAAYELRRRILPYVLDKTPLPAELDNLVYVEIKDRELGDSNLLRAIFGRDFVPDPTTLFPGKWNATIDAFGIAQGIYSLELRQNGQIEGESAIDKSSQVAQLLGQLGMGAFANMRIALHGTWSYDRNTQSLNLEMSMSAFGQNTTENITVLTNGRENQAVTGKDFQGRTWKFWRAT